MNPSPDIPVRRSGGDLTDYASLLRRRWPTVLLLIAAGVGSGAAALRLTPPAYTASTQVLVTSTGLQEQTNQVTNRQREALNLDTEAQIARSAIVARKAGVALGSAPGPAEVSVPPNTSVLEISYTAADPRSAATGAGAYAQAYLANRREATTRALDIQLKTLLTKLKQVNASLATVVAALPGLAKGTAERTMALQRQNVLSRQVYNLTVKYDALRTVAVTPGSVISEAAVPTAPSLPSPPLYLGSGLMLGLLSGVGLAWLRDRPRALGEPRDRRFVTAIDALAGAVRAIPGGEGAGALAGRQGAVLLVGVPGRSSRGVARAVRKLKRQGVPVIGALLTPREGAQTTGAREEERQGDNRLPAERGFPEPPFGALPGSALTPQNGGPVVGGGMTATPVSGTSPAGGRRVFPP
ncbi:Wzz/FepE/Etk N-terminal domain-containing protein [Streptosporangium carneum]|uniref:Polysaccharide chain length determinant N-terminal domain-containing protein n=1 Tax=Streptosporangium carneum TaxID=47481 RepID=A0A9W6MF75_9ACTN|nr:Wzz/FepE/Etk N-terminal domain-containing protein [Streptosporangium carneum]GLK11578.1 hypothetical protein GCM10017600_49850 [Streptosporangium carneum]